MDNQQGARWLAHEAHDLGAEIATDRGVPLAGKSQKQDDSRPPGFSLLDCIDERKFAQSMAALVSLGFRVRGDISPEGGGRREER